MTSWPLWNGRNVTECASIWCFASLWRSNAVVVLNSDGHKSQRVLKTAKETYNIIYYIYSFFYFFIRERRAFNTTSTVFISSRNNDINWLIKMSLGSKLYVVYGNQRREDKRDQISPREIQLQPRVLMSGNYVFWCHEIINQNGSCFSQHVFECR